jgi:hypothetical protein
MSRIRAKVAFEEIAELLVEIDARSLDILGDFPPCA